MSVTRQGMDGFAVQLMVVLCSLWGLQQVAIKLAAPDMAPLLQVGLRSVLAALLVALFMLWRRQPWQLGDGTLRAGALVGLLFALEFLFIAEALVRTSAAHMVVLLYTAPIFAALGLHLWLPGERLRRLQWLGILIAFAGILLAFGGGALGQRISAQVLLGDFFALLAGLFWGRPPWRCVAPGWPRPRRPRPCSTNCSALPVWCCRPGWADRSRRRT